jgi:hypothetical protein
MRASLLPRAIVTLAPLLILASCNPGTPPTGNDQAQLVIRADVSGTAVATVVVEVTAPDLTTPLVFNIVVVNGVASGVITIPAGSNRTIAIRAFDAAGVETHGGQVTVNVQSGTNPTVSLTLSPLAGDVPIQATLGSVVISLDLTSRSLSLGGTNTVPLQATIVNAGGHAPGSVSWATHDPGVASVDATGDLTALVTAVGVGTTNIYATFQGAAASATITVTP